MLYSRFNPRLFRQIESTRSGRYRGRGRKQPSNERGNREPTPEPNPESRIDPNAQVATAIQ